MNTRITCLLPKNMKPNKETFEGLGFKFKNIKDKNFCLATLPTGWKSVWDNILDCPCIVDEKECDRASYFFSNGKSTLLMGIRFSIHTEPIGSGHYPSHIIVSVIDNSNNDKTLFVVGQCEREGSAEYIELIDKAHVYLDEHYPDWKDPTKYWD